MKKLSKLLLATAMGVSTISASASTFVGDRTDFRDETIYFAMTTRFYDGDPQNNVCGWDHQDVQIANNDPDWRGDFKGLIDKLDYIKALGFTAIWITPIVQNCSGTDFHGYHAMDFSSVDLRYESRTEWGSSEDVKFEDLINAAHAKGMKIVLDIVLNHTSNFGEKHFAELFYRSQDIRNQANVQAAIRPNYDRLPSNYDELGGTAQYNARFPYLKNSGGQNLDTNNYWHHVGTGWNWDYPNRWWGQIAGDCVDLNTENPAVAEYLVDCYGKFIEMGVDGFRIDTTGHISRLTFNTQFIPQFLEIAEQNKDKRLNGCPFFMFGECCARYSDVTYRGQNNLSSYFYTWKSPEASITEYKKYTAEWWANQVIMEGDDAAYGNMQTCLDEPSDAPTSDNVFMKNGAWHEPDYSNYSGFSIIDFPMHYNFNNAGAAVNVAKSGDQYYNDASYNVVYVDSHDYCPGPNDGTRFNGSTAQWAENLSLMFTFRGIPCIYYGSEVEFQKGKKVDAGGTDMPVKDSGRAYFGHYLEGDVNASDFGVFTASGNAKETLNGDLSQHIIRLNQIRAAVPALRKGQYTWDGCSANGGWAFKRAYKDSYALVAINGGATFTNVPEGTYTDLVTGQTYNGGGTITVDAPKTQGQLRVLVKDWKGGKVGEDGKFIYTTSSVSKGGTPSFEDPGTSTYYTAEDAVSDPAVSFSPAGGTFKTETVTVTASLNSEAVSGWYQIEGGQRVTISGSSSEFILGQNMSYGESIKVLWGATGSTGTEYTGSVTYKKVDPNATITVYVKGTSGINLYAWGKNGSGQSVEPCGAWPGKTLTETVNIDGVDYYYVTFDDMESVNIIFNKGSEKTGDIEGITADTFYEYNGGTSATEIEGGVVVKDAAVTFSPNGGTFYDTVTVTATVKNATSAWYKIGNGQEVNISGQATFTLGDDMNIGDAVTVSWSATGDTGVKTGSVTFTKIEKPIEPEGIKVYFDNSLVNWNPVKVYFWGGESTVDWGAQPTMTLVEGNIYSYVLPTGTTGVIFTNNGGNGSNQSMDVANPINNHLYRASANGGDKAKVEDLGEYKAQSAIDSIEADQEIAPVYYNLQGIEVKDPAPGIYIERRGNSVRKVIIR